MPLVKPGVWHENVFADRTWHANLWLEYGTAAPPTEILTGGPPVPFPKFPIYLMFLLKEYIKTKIGDEEK